MLTSLHIKNFAIVAELDLDFNSGMTALTGETGAGKSIMIDALLLALGERADVSLIRPGQQSCDIQATFSYVLASGPAQWLAAHDAETDDQEILLRRVITLEGRSKSYINGVPFPLQKVKELSELLIHVYGQHQHQTLLTHSTHREQLDLYADHQALRDELALLYRHCQRLAAERQACAQIDPGEMLSLQADLSELQALNPAEGEMTALHQEHQHLHHAKDYIEQSQAMLELLQADDGPSIRDQLQTVLQRLAGLPQDNVHIHSAKELLDQTVILCDEAYDDLNAFATGVQLDPERLMAMESRMSALHHMARKYHIDVAQLATHIQTLEQRLETVQQAQSRQAQLDQEQQAAKAAYHALALQLRASRIQHAQALAAEISAHIQQLGMPHGFMTIELTPLDKMQVHGMDKIEYKVSTNPGMQPDLLSDIASGGELSRISLAIQMIAAQKGSTPTLIFDEVDVGIGGATAAIVGRSLRHLGEQLQVFCVTHQPQVAANAHHHFVVTKHSDHQETFSAITALSKEKKVEEIARMLGGLTITEQSRSHAQELLESLAH